MKWMVIGCEWNPCCLNMRRKIDHNGTFENTIGESVVQCYVNVHVLFVTIFLLDCWNNKTMSCHITAYSVWKSFVLFFNTSSESN